MIEQTVTIIIQNPYKTQSTHANERNEFERENVCYVHHYFFCDHLPLNANLQFFYFYPNQSLFRLFLPFCLFIRISILSLTFICNAFYSNLILSTSSKQCLFNAFNANQTIIVQAKDVEHSYFFRKLTHKYVPRFTS